MKEAGKNALLLTTTLLVIFALLELLFRIVIPPVSRVNVTSLPRSVKMDAPVNGIPYLFRNNSSATQFYQTDPRGYFDADASLTYTINNHGFRGPDFPLEKPDNSFRIIGIGDSFTFGSGARYEDTFLSRLEEILASPGNKTIEVMNFGAPGFNTVHEVNLLKFKAIEFKPDLVVICFFLNDISKGGAARDLMDAQPSGMLPSLRNNSRLVDQVAHTIERQQAADALIQTYSSSVNPGSPRWRAAKKALSKARRLAEENNFELVLMIFPMLWNISEDYPFLNVHAAVTEYARKQSIQVLDLLPAFDGYDGPELWVHPNDLHPNEIAHDVAARALADFLTARYADQWVNNH